MTVEEAEQAAIAAGALEPQGMVEGMAYNFKKSEDWSFRWEYTAKAQDRLARWTNGIMQGVPPYQLKSRLG